MPARWRLTAKHYLNIQLPDGAPATEWEYQEADRATGRAIRKRFVVPTLLDPDFPGDWNSQDGVIVCNAADRAFPRDYIFLGSPTPEMEPLNDEAQAITDATAPAWVHPIESLPGQGYNQSLLDTLASQLSQAMSKSPLPKTQSIGGVSQEQFDELKKQMDTLMEANAALVAKMSEPTEARRR